MTDNDNFLSNARHGLPWNKAKQIGAKPPLLPKHFWSIRTRLLLEGRTRDLAMFNLAGQDTAELLVIPTATGGHRESQNIVG